MKRVGCDKDEERGQWEKKGVMGGKNEPEEGKKKLEALFFSELSGLACACLKTSNFSISLPN